MFSVEREDGWTLADYRPEQPVFIGPAGEPIKPANKRQADRVQITEREFPSWLIYVNICVDVMLVLGIIYRRRDRKTSSKS